MWAIAGAVADGIIVMLVMSLVGLWMWSQLQTWRTHKDGSQPRSAQTSVRMWMRFMIICRRLRKSVISLSMSSTSLISEREARLCHLGRG